MNADDPETMFDLQKCNTRSNDPKYEQFLEAFEKLLQKKSAGY